MTIRCSAIPEMADCQRRAAVKQLREKVTTKGYYVRPDVRGIASVVGQAVHAGAAHMLSAVLREGRLGSVPEAQEVAVNELRKAEPEVSWDWTTSNIRIGEIQVLRMVESYELIAQTLVPTGVEITLSGTISGTAATGHPDVVNKGTNLRDLKTGRVKCYDLQMGGYIDLLEQAGTTIGTTHIDYVPRVKASKPQPEPWSEEIDTKGCLTAARVVVKQFKAAMDEFDTTGDISAFAVNPSSPYCTEVTCPAFDTETCRYGRVYEKP